MNRFELENFEFVWMVESEVLYFDILPSYVFICGANQEVPVSVSLSGCPSQILSSEKNCIHQTYASANLLLAMLWLGLFVSSSCLGLESPIICWHPT